ncbi:MAG TPA: hypothetical protein V6C58_14620, partial [Allocoleopsis sp.]
TSTFQEGMRTYNDPFDALNKLCRSFDAIFFQTRGEWHFVYLEDWIRNLGLTGTRWDYLGVEQQYVSNQRERINVGLTRDTKLINEDALIGYLRPAKKVRTTYNFVSQVAPIKNLDLNDTTGSGTAGTGYIDFTLTDWTVISGTVKARKYLDSDNNETYRRLNFNTNGAINSSSGLVGNGDKFKFRVDLQKAANKGIGVGIRVVRVGFTTTYYYLKADGKWVSGTSTWQLMGLATSVVSFTFNGTLVYESVDPIPQDGLLEIYLQADSGVEFWNMSMAYEYNPSNGFRAAGFYHEESQTTELKTKIDNEIFISDSVGVATRGAMMLKASITPLQYWEHKSITEKLKFSNIINRAVYKKSYRNYYTLEGALLNNYDGNYLFTPLNTFLFDVIDNLEFMLSTIKVDLINDKSEATFVELLNTSNSDDFDEVGTEVFKYLDYKTDTPEIKEKEKFVPDNRFGVIGYLVQLFTRKKKR